VEREQMIDWLGVIVLNMRLTDRTLQPGSPFLGAGGFVQHQVHDVAGLASLQVTAPAEQWQGALDAALQTLRQLLAQGVQPADLQRVLPLMRSALQAMVAQAPTREHAAIADALVNAALPRGVYQSAAQGLAEAEPMLASVTAEEITTALRRLYGGATPLLFRSVKAAPAGTEALSQQLAQSLAKPVVVAAPQTVADWPYTDFGAASAIVSKTTDAELGATTVQFANGTRLVVKPTAQEKDRLSVQVLLGQGRAGLAREHVPSVWALDFMPLGGTGKRSLGEQLQWQQSTGRLVGVRLSVAESAFVLQGDTRPADLAAELQVLAAYARDPGFRPEMGEKMAGVAPMMANQFETLPGLVFAREMSRIMNASEPRIGGVPTAAELLATRPEQVPAMLREALAGAPDVVIVGDVSLDAAVAAVHATFGAGPNRARLPLAGLKLTPAADGGESHVVYHKGRADQAELGRIWPMPDRWTNPALSDTGRVAAAILQTRLIDSVREKLGITYSPNVGGGGSVDVAGQGSFQVFIETPPDKFDTFRSLLLAQLTELAAKPVSADELQRAKQPMIEDRIKAPEHNGHWGYWLPRILNQPRMKAVMLGEADDLRAITAEQVQALFRDHIVKREPIEVVAKAR
jgi:zinc protease